MVTVTGRGDNPTYHVFWGLLRQSKSEVLLGWRFYNWGWRLTNRSLHGYHLRFKLARGELALANCWRNLHKTRWLVGQRTNPVEQAWRKEKHALIGSGHQIKCKQWSKRKNHWQSKNCNSKHRKKKQLTLFLPVQLFCRWLLLVQHLGQAAWA